MNPRFSVANWFKTRLVPLCQSGIYQAYLKRSMDLVFGVMAALVLSPLFLLLAVLVRTQLGSPIIFKQTRPGLGERLFTLYKFRTMTNERDEAGNLLPDLMRLTKLGGFLRATSLDELPEIWNIVLGDMSIVGPRPQLIKDMIFMTPEQRQRHTVLPGLTGLAQISGRNGITWERKLSLDLEYIRHVTFWGDCKIIVKTFEKVFKREGIGYAGNDIAEDLGDYLVRAQVISEKQYEQTLSELREHEWIESDSKRRGEIVDKSSE